MRAASVLVWSAQPTSQLFVKVFVVVTVKFHLQGSPLVIDGVFLAFGRFFLIVLVVDDIVLFVVARRSSQRYGCRQHEAQDVSLT